MVMILSIISILFWIYIGFKLFSAPNLMEINNKLPFFTPIQYRPPSNYIADQFSSQFVYLLLSLLLTLFGCGILKATDFDHFIIFTNSAFFFKTLTMLGLYHHTIFRKW